MNKIGENWYCTIQINRSEPLHYIIHAIDEYGRVNSTKEKIVVAKISPPHPQPENHPPVVTIQYPSEEITVSGTLTIQGEAWDEDGNDTIVSVEVKIDNGEWITAEGITTWQYVWNTTNVINGNLTIYVRAYDGELYSEIVSVTVNVFNNHKPSIEILEPKGGSKVKGIITIKGKAWDEDGNETISKIAIKIDDGEWIFINISTLWNHTLDTKQLKDGEHTIYACCWDNNNESSIAEITIKVGNKKKTPGFEFILAMVAIASIALYLKRKR